ncbi:MAG TPA: tyrosine-type recombinase/integrase [Terriglobales bacterium]
MTKPAGRTWSRKRRMNSTASSCMTLLRAGEGISDNFVWYVVGRHCRKIGLAHVAPHDLRRTCAKLCHTSGGELEQIQFLLGHVSACSQELI